ncbi:feruloyl-CoA synthase [Devosia sp. XJ19-1]|uniref:Feruloyl-CoA synthase n=1 Tax=Devosia ureilytica TaxID=2952754 RepID=A0A9Q4ASD5_9HYPH|nr:feruloyl-CoA synthase [Devosia ureilytica]MCP8885159.1 feruloyl-CoA synthase [Devosia ureilytica]MCP8888881.1 feruloyl-CoA synthase [Devosia ureilytica]
MDVKSTPIRQVRLGNMAASAEHRADGSAIIRSVEALGAYPRAIVDALEAWAHKTPDAMLIADRDGDGWRELTFGEVLARIPPLAQALLDAGLSPERPLMILSGNEIEHFLLGMAAIWVGIPYAPISPAYSLVSTDFGKLRHIAGLLTPGMLYASDGAKFAPAIDAVFGPDVPLIVRSNPIGGRAASLFNDLLTTPVTSAVADAHDAISADTIAKVLFTSGSTGLPKGVITTNRMMACNQQMIRQALAFVADEPPVLLDWMPWNHVAGGSHNTGIAIYNGGSFYIDDGQPTPARIGRTLENLKTVQPTLFTNVPKAYEFLVAAFDEHPEARRNLFARLKLLQYAGAGLSQHVFEGLDKAARAETGERVLIITGYGSTETAPFAFTTTWPVEEAGHIGLPAAGMTVKLVPNGDKTELRLKGPNVTPGYWRDAEKTREAFDEEGFYQIGDAVRFADPDDLTRGFVFDGRVTEDFKLSTGTWVNFAAVRTAVISACAPLIRDVVLTGLDSNFIGAMIFPDLNACARHAGLPADAEAEAIVGHPAVRQKFAESLGALAQKSTGSSNHVARALVMTALPDIDKGEVTDKGSINQRAVRTHRPDLVASLYAEPPGPDIFVLSRKGA